MTLITVTEEDWHNVNRELAEMQSRNDGLLQDVERLREHLRRKDELLEAERELHARELERLQKEIEALWETIRQAQNDRA